MIYDKAGTLETERLILLSLTVDDFEAVNKSDYKTKQSESELKAIQRDLPR